jgi:O-methyltransferase involved in polyketide biosynthesis
METEKVHFTKEKEMLLATLYGRALDSRLKDPILGDKLADHVVSRIDYDFKKLKLGGNVPMSVAVRAKYLDRWTREFIAVNQGSTVLHLGCGLDSRIYRIDPPATVRWYDVDYPDVIDIRRRLYPERHDYRMIGSSVTDLSWLDGIPSDRPALVIAEGLVQFLPEKKGIRLFKCITDRFPGGQFIFDAWSRWTIRLSRLQPTVRSTGASMGWGFDDPHELERYIPRLKFVTEFSFLGVPELARCSWAERKMCHIMDRITFLRRMSRLLRYRF